MTAAHKISAGALAVWAGLSLSSAAWAAESVRYQDKYQERCGTAPIGPDIAQNPAISDEKMAELKKDVVTFIKTSDEFQNCIYKVLDEGPTFKKDTSREEILSVGAKFENAGNKIILDNQSEKERIGEAFNSLVDMRHGGSGGSSPKTPKPAAKTTAPAVIPTAPEGMLPTVPTGGQRITAKAKPTLKP